MKIKYSVEELYPVYDFDDCYGDPKPGDDHVDVSTEELAEYQAAKDRFLKALHPLQDKIEAEALRRSLEKSRGR